MTLSPKTDFYKSKKTFVDWMVKIDLLKDQISKLSGFEDTTILAISRLILLSQVVEWELKQLLSSVGFEYALLKLIPKERNKTPKDYDGHTLGMLSSELRQYEKIKDVGGLKNLSRKLGSRKSGFVKLRNDFAHKLFDPSTSIKDLHDDAVKGAKMADEILSDIEKISRESRDRVDKLLR